MFHILRGLVATVDIKLAKHANIYILKELSIAKVENSCFIAFKNQHMMTAGHYYASLELVYFYFMI